MHVSGTCLIVINRLRAFYPQKLKPSIGITDFIGETAVSGNPLVKPSTDGSVISVSGNDTTYLSSGQYGIEYDSQRKVIYPRSQAIFHDNILGSYGYDTARPCQILWTAVALQAGYVSAGTRRADQGFNEMGVVYTVPAKYSWVGDLQHTDGGACQGFFSLIQIALPKNYANQVVYGGIRFRVIGSSKSPRWYSVTWNAGGTVFFSYNDVLVNVVNAAGKMISGIPDENGWVAVDQIKLGSNIEDLQKQGANNASPAAHAMEVRLLAGILTLKIGSQDTPFVWPHPTTGPTKNKDGSTSDFAGVADWYIDKFMSVGFQTLGTIWSVHPTKWATNAIYLSAQTNIGFKPLDNDLTGMVFTTHYAPFSPKAKGSITGPNPKLPATEVGFRPDQAEARYQALASYYFDPNSPNTTTEVQYLLTFNNYRDGTSPSGSDYGNFTSAVRAVSFDIPSTAYKWQDSAYVLGLGASHGGNVLVDPAKFPGGIPGPESFEITTTLDYNQLVITRSMTMTFDNFHAQFSGMNGSGFLDKNKHFGIQVSVGLAGSGQIMEFQGIANTRMVNNWNGGGKDKVTITCEDLWLLLDINAYNIPWMDGWNVYYVMYYLAQLAGLTDDQIGFLPFVPWRAYDDIAGNYTAQNPAYFMPIAPTGTPLTRFDGAQKIKDIMLKISNSIGFVMYFDAQAKLQFRKFKVTAPTGPVKMFNYYSGSFENGVYVANGIWEGSYTSDMHDVGNYVVAFGKSLAPTASAWRITGGDATDFESIYNDLNSNGNYKGFMDALIWEDQIFATDAFAQEAAEAMLNFLRLPDKTVQFTAFYQPEGIQTGQFIQVNYPRTGASDASLYFFVVSTTVHQGPKETPRIDITARVMPNF